MDIRREVTELAYKIFCEGKLEKLKRNPEYISTLSALQQDDKEYIIGIDVAHEDYEDASMMRWFSKNEDGSLMLEAYRYLK